jgi:phage shock protein C
MDTRLYRSREDRMLAGVAGGLAEMWDADPSLVRIVWALLVVLTGGIFLVIYIVMAIVVPEEPYPGAISGGTAAAPPPPGAVPGWTPPGAPAAPVGDPAAAPPPNTFASTPPASDWRAQRYAEREQRRAARAARRAERGSDGRTGTIIVGAILVLLGVGFLVRQYLPSFDWDYVWPAVLVALGVVVILAALRPGDRGGAGPS